MTRTDITLNTQSYDDSIVTVTSTTIDASLVTAGLRVTNGFSVKNGSTRIRVTNTHSSPHNMLLRAGGYATGINGDVTYAVTNATTEYVIVNVYEGQLKQLDGSLYIDFSTGFTGAIEITGEATHLTSGYASYS